MREVNHLPSSSAVFSRGGLGLPSHIVKLASYDIRWPDLFSAEKQRIALALKLMSPQIEHIGSTAVRGMASKPVIDIMLGILDSSCIDEAEATLDKLGYYCHGERGIPGRLFFTYGEPCTVHLHMVQYNGDLWKGHLLFRNALRRSTEISSKYLAVKANLAKQFPLDRQAYTLGKADFIENVLQLERLRDTNTPDPDGEDSAW